MLILDAPYADIERQILSSAPERGGGLMGPRGSTVVTRFIFDAEAVTTRTTYTPSDRLVDLVAHVETTTDLEFKGILHSHPVSSTRPSLGDEVAIGRFFEQNPHRAEIYLPLAFPSWHNDSRQGSSGACSTRFPLVGYKAVRVRRGHQRTRSRSLRRSGGGPFEVIPDEIGVIPVREGADLLRSRIARSGGEQFGLPAGLVEMKVEHVEMFGYALIGKTADVIYLVTSAYPVCAPAILLTTAGKPTRELQVPWMYFQHGHTKSVALAAKEVVDALRTPSAPPEPVPGAAAGSTPVPDGHALSGSPSTDGVSHGPQSVGPKRIAPEDPGEPTGRSGSAGLATPEDRRGS